MNSISALNRLTRMEAKIDASSSQHWSGLSHARTISGMGNTTVLSCSSSTNHLFLPKTFPPRETLNPLSLIEPIFAGVHQLFTIHYQLFIAFFSCFKLGGDVDKL